TATTGTEVPVVPNNRQSPRAATRSDRASTIATSALPVSRRDDTSREAIRPPCGSSDNAGSTDSGRESAVRSSRSNTPSSTKVYDALTYGCHQPGVGLTIHNDN